MDVSHEVIVQESGSISVGTQTQAEHLEENSITQIHASREEMYRRIEAFCRHKRSQIDVSNVIEYSKPSDREYTSARVDAVKVHQSKSQRVERVHNVVGPNPKTKTSVELLEEELLAAQESRQVPRNLCPAHKVDIVEQRLQSMEEYLDCDSSSEDSSKTTMYRLRMLEQHLLQLEGSSPEYTTGTKGGESSKSLLQSSNQMAYSQLHKKSAPRIVAGHPANKM